MVQTTWQNSGLVLHFMTTYVYYVQTCLTICLTDMQKYMKSIIHILITISLYILEAAKALKWSCMFHNTTNKLLPRISRILLCIFSHNPNTWMLNKCPMVARNHKKTVWIVKCSLGVWTTTICNPQMPIQASVKPWTFWHILENKASSFFFLKQFILTHRLWIIVHGLK